MNTFFIHDKSQYIFSCIREDSSRIHFYSFFSRASGRCFSLQIIPLPRADAIVSYGVRSAVIYTGSTHIDLIAPRDKIRFITVKKDAKDLLFSLNGSFLFLFCHSCEGRNLASENRFRHLPEELLFSLYVRIHFLRRKWQIISII